MDRRDEVVRRRLLDRLADRFAVRTTLIEAGPGFGKSTLLRQLLGERNDVDGAVGTDSPHLRDEHRRGIDALVSTLRRGAGRQEFVAAVLDALEEATDRAHVPGDGVANAVWSAASDDVCIIVDDAHWLADDAVDALVEISGTLPTNGHLVVAMRPDTSGRFSRLMASGSTLALREADLAFDCDERLSFGALRGASVVVDEHSGWPALLELELSTGRTGALRYIISEVVKSLEPSTVDACRRLAVLPWVDDQLASDLLGRPTSVELLIEGLPLTRSDDGRVELHDLLRTALHVDWPDHEHRAALIAASAVAIERGDIDIALDCSARRWGS